MHATVQHFVFNQLEDDTLKNLAYMYSLQILLQHFAWTFEKFLQQFLYMFQNDYFLLLVFDSIPSALKCNMIKWSQSCYKSLLVWRGKNRNKFGIERDTKHQSLNTRFP